MSESQQRALTALQRRGRLRSLVLRSGRDFSSNDYLGFAASDVLRDAADDALARGVALGSTGSRLLRGNDPEIERLEVDAAKMFGAEACLFFSGGYTANQTLLATLPQRDDLIVADALAHASMWDGMRASKAEFVTVAHNDVDAFSDAASSWRQRGGSGRVWLVVESLFSMDGDVAPLADLHEVAQQNEGMLIIDEAHATGVFGPEGRGFAAHLEGKDNVITVHTCGKALGVMGALVLLPRVFRDFLINRSRAFIYATAPSPLIAATVRASLDLSRRSDPLREELHDLVAFAAQAIQSELGLPATATQIQPIQIGSESAAVAVSKAMIADGFDVRAVRPPTVPEGTSRLRVSLTRNVSKTDVADMVDRLGRALKDQLS